MLERQKLFYERYFGEILVFSQAHDKKGDYEEGRLSPSWFPHALCLRYSGCFIGPRSH